MESNLSRKFQLAVKSLRIIGYFDSSTLNKLYGTFFITIDIIVLLGEIIGFVNRNTIQERIEIMYTANAAVLGLFFYIRLKRHQKMVQQFFLVISEPHLNDDLRLEALELTVQEAGNIIPRLMTIMSVLVSPFLVAWCFTPLLKDFDLRNKNFYIAPYLFQCTDDGENRFPLTFLCSKRESYVEFVLINLLTTILGTWGVLTIIMWQSSFLVCICIFVGANITVIKGRLLPLVENLPVPSRHKRFYEDENVLRSTLIQVIQHQQYLHRTMKIIIPFLETVCDLFLTLCVTNLAVAFYTMGTQIQLSGYWVFQIKTGGMLGSWLWVLFFNSHCAQIISEMQTEINNAIYSVAWYNQNVEFQKLIIQSQILLQKPFELKSFGMYSINRKLFASVMRISYSALNLMFAQFNEE